MNFLANTRIKNKLIIMLIIPVVGLLYFSVSGFVDKLRVAGEMDSLQELSALSVKVSEFTHELQKERGRTGSFLSSGGKTFAKELEAQRALTDEKLTNLNSYLVGFGKSGFGDEFSTTLNIALSAVSGLGVERASISQLKIKSADAINFYSEINERMLDVITSSATITTSTRISGHLSGYYFLLNKKNNLGLERAILSKVFLNDSFTPETRTAYDKVVKAQEIYMRQFFSYASPEQRDLLRDTLKGRAVEETARLRAIAIEKEYVGGFGVDPGQWFDTVTGEIDLLKNVIGSISQELDSDTEAMRAAANTGLIVFAIIIIVSIIVTFGLAINITRNISRQVRDLVESITDLARGNLSRRVNVTSADEIGQLGEALNDMGQKIEESAERERRQAERERDAANQLKQGVEIIREGVGKISTGDLRHQFRISGNDALSELSGHLNGMSASLAGMAAEVSEASGALNSAITEVQSSVTAQSSGTSEQAASINETVSTLEEIRATSKQTQEKAMTLGSSAERTREEGVRGAGSVEDTVEAMLSIRGKVESIAENILALSEKTQQIGEITTTVNNLAQQLKMLALNASIEASKAGEAGKGFAVVAAEVRELAEQSHQSTQQVQKILQDIQNATERAVMVTEEGTKGVDEGVFLVEQTGSIISSLSKVISESAIASQQIVAAVRQEGAGIDQIATAMTDINKATSQSVSSTQQTMEAVRNMGEIAAKLKESAGVYKV